MLLFSFLFNLVPSLAIQSFSTSSVLFFVRLTWSHKSSALQWTHVFVLTQITLKRLNTIPLCGRQKNNIWLSAFSLWSEFAETLPPAWSSSVTSTSGPIHHQGSIFHWTRFPQKNTVSGVDIIYPSHYDIKVKHMDKRKMNIVIGAWNGVYFCRNSKNLVMFP